MGDEEFRALRFLNIFGIFSETSDIPIPCLILISLVDFGVFNWVVLPGYLE